MSEDMRYVARMPGEPGYYASCVDLPAYAKETAKHIARWIKEGAIVERVTCEESAKGMAIWGEWRDAQEAAAAKTKQRGLFNE